MALEKSWVIFIREKQIRKIMCVKNYTYIKGLSIYLEQFTEKPKHRHKMEGIHNKTIINKEKPSYRDVLVANTQSDISAPKITGQQIVTDSEELGEQRTKYGRIGRI
ncbi:unnamed protein product [Arctia plantaginis]|uniref:Uncharacterized protein n=1 Tax=Arctia plantaginis TaxID=874455 RepID=A0A8S1A7V7_ARCPL|nr:unnamed protein product [Arctia plantaginis]